MMPAARTSTSFAGGFSVYGIEKKREVRYNINITMNAHSVCKGRVNMNNVRIGSKNAHRSAVNPCKAIFFPAKQRGL